MIPETLRAQIETLIKPRMCRTDYTSHLWEYEKGYNEAITDVLALLAERSAERETTQEK